MAPSASTSSKFTGNVSFYSFLATFRRPAFLERNMNKIYQHNENRLRRTGKETEQTYVERERRIDKIASRLANNEIDQVAHIGVQNLSINSSTGQGSTASSAFGLRKRESHQTAGKIEYHFIDDDAPAPKRDMELMLHNYRCIFCHRQNFMNSSKRLAFHLVACHDLFDYGFREMSTGKAKQKKCTITIRPSTKLSEFTGETRKKDEREFVWICRNKPFDIKLFLQGHWGWLKEKNTSAADPALQSNEVLPDLDKIGELPHAPRRRFVVPTPRVLKPEAPVFMRSKSKRFVDPGEELSESDEDVDDEWIIMKHEETIEDYADIDQCEKTMMKAWNKHLYIERPIGRAQVTASLIRFTRKNRSWIREEPVWTVEFWKMCLNFIQFGTVDAHCLKYCMDILNSGGSEKGKERQRAPQGTPGRTPRARKPRKTMDGVQPVSSTGQPIEIIDLSKDDDDGAAASGYTSAAAAFANSSGVCKCTRGWRRSDMVACEGDNCKCGWYHMSCVGLSERPSGVWLCDDCKSRRKSNIHIEIG